MFCREVENQLGDDCWSVGGIRDRSGTGIGFASFAFSQIGTFLHTFVAEAFFEQIRIDLERKTEQALGGTDLWTGLSEVSAHNVVSQRTFPCQFIFGQIYFLPGQKVLTCSVRIFELCEQIDSYINNMEPYALRFAFRSMFRLFINILIWWINRFASFWLLILEHFTKCISDKYFQVHLPAK